MGYVSTNGAAIYSHPVQCLKLPYPVENAICADQLLGFRVRFGGSSRDSNLSDQ
jgi:hypothetical protein